MRPWLMTDGKGETNKNGDNVLHLMSLKQEERRIVILASYSFTALVQRISINCSEIQNTSFITDKVPGTESFDA